MAEKHSQPKVSIIMNCLNGARYLREAMDSAYAQTYDNWEVIFWDNASTDNSADIAKSYGARVKYFRSEHTYPLGRARNLAFKEATGEYIALLDCDDIWLPNKLKEQIALFDKNPNLGMTYSNSIFFNDEGEKFRMFDAVTPRRGYVFGDLLKKNFISSETMIFCKSALYNFDCIFNEEFTMVMDYELTLRLAYLHEIDFVEKPLSKWRMHPGSESSKKRFLIPYETAKMLHALLAWKPDISERFNPELEIFKKALSYDFALEAWFKEDRQAMKRHLIPYLNDKKFFLTYMLSSFMSYSRFEQIKPGLQRILRGVNRSG